MSVVKASDLVYCRFRLPDLEKSKQFLTDFGLILAHSEPGRRFYRGSDPHPYCYVVEEGPQHFLGFAFEAKSREDLDRLAAYGDTTVTPIDAPGGGERVRLKEPNGYDVDLVWGIERAEPVPVERQLVNTGAQPLQRAGELYRLKRGEPTPVKRLAHVVLGSPLISETTRWFHDTLGTITSDEVFAGPDQKHIGSFVRVDNGDEYVDHHAIFLIIAPHAGLQHVSFEVQDIDAVMADHYYLKTLNRYEHMWGIGRHLLGSQVFDYWADPFGYAHEHWADSDRLNASTPTAISNARESMITQWGEEPPEKFKQSVIP